MFYNVDFKKLGIRLLPSFIRGTIISTYLGVLLYEMDVLNASFITFINQTRLSLNYNSQVMALQAALNGIFAGDRKATVIEIVDDSTEKPLLFAFYKEENQPELGVAYYKSENTELFSIGWYVSEYDTQRDFHIKIPSALVPKEPLISAFVNRYKLAEKRFDFIPY
jgi:hypothetical protein